MGRYLKISAGVPQEFTGGEKLRSLRVKYKDNKHEFSLFHLNIASLSKHKDELETILMMLKYKFDIIGISETKIQKNIIPNYDISLKGYKPYSTPTEGEKGEV